MTKTNINKQRTNFLSHYHGINRLFIYFFEKQNLDLNESAQSLILSYMNEGINKILETQLDRVVYKLIDMK